MRLVTGACVCALVVACGPVNQSVAPRAASATTATSQAPAPDAGLSAARELLSLVPGDAEQCIVIMPSRVEPALRPLAGLVSQVDRVPWALESEVVAYVRAELTPHADRRRIVEVVRFANATPLEMRKDLQRNGGREWSWAMPARGCDDLLPCPVSRVDPVDAHTLRITTGDWPYEDERTKSACLALLERAPEAIELSERLGAEGRGHGSVERVLLPRENGLERIETRSYADAEAAERARVKWLGGYQDQPQVAGVVVEPEYQLQGALLSQRVALRWDDLSLVVQDQERLRRALRGNDREGNVADDEVDPTDVELVRAHVDTRMLAIEALPSTERTKNLGSVRELLLRARASHPFDEGLARRLFALCLFGLHDAKAAREVAENMIARGSAHAAAWELSLRTALAHGDGAALASKLVSAHRIFAADAQTLATLLVRQVREGADYERAEWAALLARSLGQRAQSMRTEAAPALPLSPGSLIRMLALLASASPAAESGGIGVHVLITGPELRPDATSSDPSLWIQRTELKGTPAVALAATSWDASQVLALSRAVDLIAPDSSELWVGFEPLRETQRHGSLVRLAFQRDDRGFVLQRVSKNLSHVRWPELIRHVADPQSRLQGALFPPDALAIEARSAEEMQAWSQAVAPLEGITCMVDGAALTCQGTLHDHQAAERALRAIARVSLAPEVRLFTSGVD